MPRPLPDQLLVRLRTLQEDYFTRCLTPPSCKVISLPDTALEGDKQALGPPRSDPALHVRAGDRRELPATA
jgi:hypothetical protein